MTTKTSTYAERVAAGAAWLDANYPGWVALVDLDRLRLTSSCDCILGQQFGDYWAAPLLGDLPPNLDPMTSSEFRKRAIALGFSAAWELDNGDSFDALEDEWRALIAARTAVSA